MTIAATHRQGCRSGTASMAVGGGESSTVVTRISTVCSSRERSVDRAVDDGLVDHALLDTPVRGDGLVVTGLDEVLERLLQRLRQWGALLHRPAVRRGVEDLARGHQL